MPFLKRRRSQQLQQPQPQQLPQKTCRGCGKFIPAHLLVCPHCGQREKPCTGCGRLITIQTLQCPHCGTPNTSRMRY